MEGVEEEYLAYCKTYSKTSAHPVASTGGASHELYQEYEKIVKEFDAGIQKSLSEDLDYESMFKDVLQLWSPVD